MKQFLLVVISMCGFASALLAQDNIIMRNGKEIKAKVQEVTLDEIKYKKADNLNGPLYTVLKSDVFMIRYENGSKETFSSSEDNLPVTVHKTHEREVRGRDDRRGGHEPRQPWARREVDLHQQANKRIVGGAVMMGFGIPALAGGATLTTLAALDMSNSNSNTSFDVFFDGPLLATGILLTSAGVLLDILGPIKLSKGIKYRRMENGGRVNLGFTPIHNPGLDRYNNTMSHRTIGAVTLTF